MVIYSVTVKVDKEVQENWVNWMKSTHIPDVMATGLFKKYNFFELLQEEEDGQTFNIQYFLESHDDLEEYMKTHAPKLQKEHTDRYLNKFVAFRTILREV